jgi:hypothetical protein
MPRYLIERLFDQRQEKLGPATSQRAIRLAEQNFPELAWEHSHVVESDEHGAVRTFCIYTAPNEEALRAHALAIGQHVVLNVYELAGDVVPADIPAEGQAVPEDYFS